MNRLQPRKYWFKKRSHVWQPISWQGWVALVLFLAIVIGNASIVLFNPYSNELLWLYLNVLATSVVAMLIIGYVKGPESNS